MAVGFLISLERKHCEKLSNRQEHPQGSRDGVKNIYETTYPVGYALCRWPPIVAHCSRIADSWHCCKQILASLVRKLVIWNDWWLHFGVLGDLGVFWDIGEHNKGFLRSSLGFVPIFGGFWCPWVSFGMLGAFTLVPWWNLGPSWDDPGTLGSTREDPLRSRLEFYRFLADYRD